MSIKAQVSRLQGVIKLCHILGSKVKKTWGNKRESGFYGVLKILFNALFRYRLSVPDSTPFTAVLKFAAEEVSLTQYFKYVVTSRK